MPNFIDLIMPQLPAPLFTIAIDKWGTGVWDFGHIDSSKYSGTLTTVPNADDCNVGGSWRMADIKAKFPEGDVQQSMCVMLGKCL